MYLYLKILSWHLQVVDAIRLCSFQDKILFLYFLYLLESLRVFL